MFSFCFTSKFTKRIIFFPRKGLFQDLQVSPLEIKDALKEEDFHNIITPCGKRDSALKVVFTILHHLYINKENNN